MLRLLTIFWLWPLSAQALGPNEVSYLLPLPRGAAEAEQMWNPLSRGKAGELFPESVYLSLPQITTDLDPKTLYRSALKVVAFRLDPCFQEANSPCRRQIRMVWQPVVDEGGYTTLDASVHTFYDLTPHSWNELISAVRALPSSGPSLAPHPILSREGYRGTYWQKLYTLILRYAGASTLSRATVMTVNPMGNTWFFSGFDVNQSENSRIVIPRLNQSVQGFTTALGSVGQVEFQAAMNPAPAAEVDFLALLRSSRRAKERMTENQILEAARSSLKLENPRLTNPGTVDCASCHTAHVITSWSLNNFPTLNWEETFMKEAFTDGGPRKPRAGDTDANVLRAFGYFKDKPVISRRVANETALVLRQLK